MSSFSRISARTLDYLARRHPWLGAIFRNRWLAAAFFASYLGSLAYFFGTIYANGGGVELVKSYSPLLFDLLVVFVISVLFMVLRAYYIEERSRIDPLVQPDPRFFMSLAGQQISFQMTDDFFSRHGAVEAILDALPLDQSDFFLAHAGSLDIPKLRLMSVTQRDGVHEWQLGMASFKEFFFTHHFADYVLSRSSSKDSTRLETLRTVFADAYVKAYGPFFGNKCNQLPLMPYTPNTLGVTGLVRVVCGADSLLVLQRRGMHESAARGHVQLSYAGTINALPHYAFPRSMANDQKKGQTNDLAQLANGEFLDELMNAENDQKNGQSIDLTQLADDEFLDELMNAELGQFIQKHEPALVVTHSPAGFCLNSQYLFQPELFVMSTIEIKNDDLLGLLSQKFSILENSPLFVMKDLSALDRAVRAGRFKLRPLCATALDKIYRPLLGL